MDKTEPTDGSSDRIDDELSDLRLSPRIVTVLFAAGGLATVAVSSLRSAPTQVEEYLFALSCYAAAGLIESAWRVRPAFGRWAAALLAVTLAPIGATVWAVPGLLVLMPAPIILAMYMLGIWGGVAATVLESGAMILLSLLVASLVGSSTPVIAVLSLWAALGILLTAHQPIVRMEHGARAHIERAQKLLGQARDRNAELDQALKDLVHVNRQLDVANERLAVARSIAEEAQKSKTEFVAKVSHEFRTPLNMIIGLTDFLLQQVDHGMEELPANSLKDIQIIHRNSEHLSTMISDVLDLSQVEAGQLILRRQWTDLAEEIAEALSVVHPLLDKKGLAVELHIPGNLPPVYCDPVRIRQVLLNLVSNAARHTDAGHIGLDVELEGGHVVVRVTDTGPGIAQKDLVRIFDPFFRGGQLAHGQGSGLGLTVCKQLIEQHNGKIWAESGSGGGSAFIFRIPAKPIVAPSSGALGWISEEWMWKEYTTPAKPPLIAPEWRMVLCDQTGRLYPLFSRLTPDNVELVETHDLAQAVAQMEDIPAHVVVLNDEDPAKLWRRLFEARSLIHDTPVIGCSFPFAAEHELTPDVVDYLVKPVTRADLRNAIETLPTPVNRVLVVDDEPEVRELFVRMLLDLDAGLNVTVAADGDEALAWMQEGRCDLVLLDIVMPNRDGWSVLQTKQTLPKMRDVPVLIMSAQDPDVQAENSIMVAVTDREGLSAEAVVQTAFHFASRLRRQPATLDPASQETVGF